jgi:hypothetical protein
MTHRCQQLSCDHSQVKFCPHCQKCYCERCGKEWPEKECNWYPWWSVSYPEKPVTVTYTTDSGETGTFSHADMQRREVVCEHHG